jgi:hypothetical protein
LKERHTRIERPQSLPTRRADPFPTQSIYGASEESCILLTFQKNVAAQIYEASHCPEHEGTDFIVRSAWILEQDFARGVDGALQNSRS